MCYLVAKNKNAHGCYALKTVHGVHLVDLKRQLNQFAVPHGIYLVNCIIYTSDADYEL